MTFRRWKQVGARYPKKRLWKYVIHSKFGKRGVIGVSDIKLITEYLKGNLLTGPSNSSSKKGPTSSSQSPPQSPKGVSVICLVFGVGLLLMSVFPAKTNADSFYPTADTQYCEFAQVASISYRSPPVPETGADSLFYDASRLRGASGNYPQTHDFFDVATLTYPNARRFNGVADYVAVPPNTTVDFGMFVFNYTGHPVSLKFGRLMLSRTDPSKGDLSRLGAPATKGGVAFMFWGSTVFRRGKIQLFDDLGTWANSSWSNPPKGVLLSSFKTIQPVQIQARNVQHSFDDSGRLILDFQLEIKNTSSYDLNDIEVIDELPDGSVFTTKTSFASGQLRVFSYQIDMGHGYPLEFSISPVVVKDPNRHVESASVGASSSMTLDPGARTLITERSDWGAGSWRGNQGDYAAVPEGDFMTVELLPYEIRSESIEIKLEPDVVVTKTVSDTDELEGVSSTSSPGEQLTYNIKLENHGARAENVVLSDFIDSELLDVVDPGGLTKSHNGLELVLGDLPHGFESSRDVVVAIKEDLSPGPFEINNIACILGSNVEERCSSTKSNGNAVSGYELKIEVGVGGNWGETANLVNPSEIEIRGIVSNVGNISLPPTSVQFATTCDPITPVKHHPRRDHALFHDTRPWEVTESLLIMQSESKTWSLDVSKLPPGKYLCRSSLESGDLQSEITYSVTISLFKQAGNGELAAAGTTNVFYCVVEATIAVILMLAQYLIRSRIQQGFL